MVEIFHETSVTDSATTAALTTINHGVAIVGLKRAWLLKYTKIVGFIKTPDLTDKLFLILAYGDPSNTEIAEALVSEAVDVENSEAYPDAQRKRRRIIDVMALDGGNTIGQERAFMWEPRIPKAGLPFMKGDGPRYVLHNPGAGALTNGPTVTSFAKFIGPWIGD